MNWRKKLAELRKQKKLSQMKLEHKAMLSEGTISRYETGRRSPEINTIARICRALGCTATELLGF